MSTTIKLSTPKERVNANPIAWEARKISMLLEDREGMEINSVIQEWIDRREKLYAKCVSVGYNPIMGRAFRAQDEREYWMTRCSDEA